MANKKSKKKVVKKKAARRPPTKREQAKGESQYKKAVRFYLAGDAQTASATIKDVLLHNPTHRKANALQRRLIDGDHLNIVDTVTGGKVYKDGNGHFMLGYPSGPGRPLGSTNKISIKKLMAAIEKVEKEQKVELLVHFARRAYKSDPVLLGLFKKVLPDLKVVEGLIASATYEMSDQEVADIRQLLKQRYTPDDDSGGSEDVKNT